MNYSIIQPMHKLHLQIATMLTKLMDEQFRIGKFKFGMDPILGIIPGLGDFFSLLLSGYIVFIALMIGLPSEKISKMIANVVMDFLVGLIPVLGDVADVFYKANKKNLVIIHEHLGTPIEGEVLKS